MLRANADGSTVRLKDVARIELGGQAYAHWESQHLSHHRHTQHAEHDPDLEVDLTRAQFTRGETFGPVDAMARPTDVGEAAQHRYELLRNRVEAALRD